MFNLTQKVLFNLTLISQIEQIFLIFFRIPCYRHSGADAALPRPYRQRLSISCLPRLKMSSNIVSQPYSIVDN